MARITGTNGNDTINGTIGRDTLIGLDGNDVLKGGDGNDTLRGGADADKLRGGSGDDTLRGDDGFDDLILVGNPAGASQGGAFVFFGSDTGFTTTTVNTNGHDRAVIKTTSLNAGDGFGVAGDEFGDEAGLGVSSAGDVNGDGFGDFLVGARSGDDGGDVAGEPYVLFGGAFGGDATPMTTTGTAAAEMLIGGLSGDTLDGGGGADVIRSGAGNDTLTVADLTFAKADGGTGTDTLVLEGSGASFDFTALADNKTESIEQIDFTGTGNNTLTLGLTDALNLSEEAHADFTGVVSAPKALVIDGDTGDFLELAPDARGAWTLQASDVQLDGTASGDYNVWSFQVGSDHFVKLAVDEDVGVTLLT